MSDFDYFEDKTENKSEGGEPDIEAGLENQDSTDNSPYEKDGAYTPDDTQRDAFSRASFYESPGEVRERYDEIFDATKPKTIGFSVASMVLGILSVICCCMGWSGLILGALAIVFSIVSRKVLGYFDGMSIAGLIVGIFGLCFGALIVFIVYGPLQEMLEEMVKDLENEGMLDPNPSLFARLSLFFRF